MDPSASSAKPPPTMDINAHNFWRELPAFLDTICTAEYISYDLEMTGITGEAIQTHPERPHEDAYQMTRSAAQTFQIVQIGMTCFFYDADQKKYKSRTYSIHLTPFFTQSSQDLARLIDRKVTFSYKTFLFLQQHGFSFEKAFVHGVPYLSRIEQLKANERYITYHSENEYGKRDLNSLDVLTKTTCDRAREQIASWIEAYPNSGSYVVIKTSSHQVATEKVKRSLNDALRQLVKTEFPDCYISFHQEEASVYMWDPKQRKEWEHERRTRIQVVSRQTAFLFIFEALVGGHFAGRIDVDLLFPADHSPTITERIEMRKRLQRYEKKRRERPPILVGHNQYFDLCFLYQTFVGNLPPTFAEFKSRAKILWPQLVDTKHMAMELGFGNHVNLSRLHQILSNQKGSFSLESEIIESIDLLSIDAEAASGAAHDAGYDSWMTAMVFGNLVQRALRRSTYDNKCRGRVTRTTVTLNMSCLLSSDTDLPGRKSDIIIKDTTRKLDPFSMVDPFSTKERSSVAGTTSPRGQNINGIKMEAFSQFNNAVNGFRKTGSVIAPSCNSGPCIPKWTEDFAGGQRKNEIWEKYGGKVRIGNAGVLDLSLT
ncbi:ribonuclease H-like domain-containing protein [Podospora fimiseda]|uniref:Ribonuclease H-like domain-containing protein n=1 Tax=Podospora fimiseda TaxID=252190 RepID=A0AAN7BWA4_9PEZI|nr:ribonuclease H-like domain-containing protein [Podospora fimiseda]